MMIFGDRTAEFTAVAQSLKNRADVHVRPRSNNPIQHKISLNKAASEIGRMIQECAEKLKELTRLAKSRSIFDDPGDRIEELTNIIKQDIQGIRVRIEALQKLVDSQRGYQTEQSSKHSGTIISSLNNSLRDTTEQFRKVLEIRTENLKTQQERKEKFIGGRRAAASSLMYQAYNPDLDGDSIDDQSADGEVSIALPLVQTREQFLEQRSQSIRVVESTISQLKQIFQELSTITAQQHELIERIDENIADAEANVEHGYKELLKYMPKVTQNRWLYLKIFAVLVVFMILFIVFFV